MDLKKAALKHAEESFRRVSTICKFQKTGNPTVLCSTLPKHWRSNKSLPTPFIILALHPIPDGTKVVIAAGNEENCTADVKNNFAEFCGQMARFSDLRFVGKSGRGKSFNLTITIQTMPVFQVITVSNAIKVTVDGPRDSRNTPKYLNGLLTKKRLINGSILLSPNTVLPSTSTQLNSVDNEISKLGKTDLKLCSFNLSQNIQSLQDQVASTSSTQLLSSIQQKTFNKSVPSPESKRRRLLKCDKSSVHMTSKSSSFDNKISFGKTSQLNILNEKNAPNTAAATMLYNSMITAAGLSTNINSTTINQKTPSIDLSSMAMPSSQMFYSPTSLSNFSSNVTNQTPLNVETTLSNFNDNENNSLTTSISKSANTNLNNQSISSNFWSNSFTKNIENKEVNQLEKFSCNQIQKLFQQNVCAPMTYKNLFAPTFLSSLLTSTTPLSEVSQNANDLLTSVLTPQSSLINPILFYQQMLSATIFNEICKQQQQLQNKNLFQKEKFINFNSKNDIIDQENKKTYLPKSESLKFNKTNYQTSLFSSLNIFATLNKEKNNLSIKSNDKIFDKNSKPLNNKQNEKIDFLHFNFKTKSKNLNKCDLLLNKKQKTQSQIQLKNCKKLWRPFDPPTYNAENSNNEILSEREIHHIYSSSSPSLALSS